MEYVPSPKVYEVCFWKRTINSTIISILTVLLGPPTSSPLSVSTTSGSLHMFASAFVPTVSVVVTNTFSPDPPLLSLSRPMNLGSAGDIRVHVHTPYSSRSSSCMSASDTESSRSIRSLRFCTFSAICSWLRCDPLRCFIVFKCNLVQSFCEREMLRSRAHCSC